MGMENMTPDDARRVLKEIMDTYAEYERLWMDVHGTMEGFSSWFSRQVLSKPIDY